MRKAIVLAAIVAATVLAGCSQPEPASDVEFTHVHGLAYDPGRGALFVATHNGLVKGVAEADAWSWTYVGADRYDYMGFTQDAEAPGVFYSSGHPDDRQAYGGANLGLRRSVDGGETWEQRSLRGEVDFHALTSIPGREGWLAGYWQGAVKVSTDAGATWTDHAGPPAQVIALAGAPGSLVAATASGLFETRDLESFGNWTAVEAEGLPPVVVTVAVSADGESWFVTAAEGQSGSTYRSVDGGASWTELTPAALRDVSAPVLFAGDPEDSSHVFASTADGLVMESKDRGATWTTVREA